MFSPPSSVPTTLETAKCVAPKRLVLVKWVYSQRERLCVNSVEIFSLTGGNFPLSLISGPFYVIRLTCEDMLLECLVCVRAEQKEREGRGREERVQNTSLNHFGFSSVWNLYWVFLFTIYI